MKCQLGKASSNLPTFRRSPTMGKFSELTTQVIWTLWHARLKSVLSMVTVEFLSIEDTLSKNWLKNPHFWKCLSYCYSGNSQIQNSFLNFLRRFMSIPSSILILKSWWNRSDMMLIQWECFAVQLLLYQLCILNKILLWQVKQFTRTEKSGISKFIVFWVRFQQLQQMLIDTESGDNTICQQKTLVMLTISYSCWINWTKHPSNLIQNFQEHLKFSSFCMPSIN